MPLNASPPPRKCSLNVLALGFTDATSNLRSPGAAGADCAPRPELVMSAVAHVSAAVNVQNRWMIWVLVICRIESPHPHSSRALHALVRKLPRRHTLLACHRFRQ